ncbi:MAG: flagellar hook-basal body complex protein, partial [Rhodocyclaceae bacterium]|nr:flagellar hook-basal body complex protein [Rhodocyclaceae bacterium]
MGFQQGLSGLNLSSKALDAIGNNVANSNTVGFKSARANFADVYAASLAGGGASQVGIGGAVTNIAQQFTQGNVTSTSNTLDLAVNGQGMYRMSNSGNITYTRNGQFQLDKNGFIVNGAGLRLTGYAADATGAIVPGNFVDLQMSNTNIAPAATTSSQVQLNLDSRATAPTSMTHGTITGSAVPASLNITAANNSFQIQVDGSPSAGPVTIDIPIATYSTAAALSQAVQTAINTNPTIAAQNTLVDVTLNTGGQLVITSRSSGTLGSQGLGSAVSLSAVAGDTGLTNLMGATPTAVAGTDSFSGTNTLSYTGSTAQTVYDSLGNGHNLTMYFAKTAQANTWQMYTSLDGTFTGNNVTTPATAGTLAGTSFTANANVNSGGNMSFTVDGVTQTVTIPANAGYTVGTLATALQTALNTAFPGPAPAPTASVSAASGHIVVTSGTGGGSSSVTVAAGAAVPALTAAGVFPGALPPAAGVFSANYSANSADLGGTMNIDGTQITIPAGVWTTASGYPSVDPNDIGAAFQTAIDQAFGTGHYTVTQAAGLLTIDGNPGGHAAVVADGSPQTLALSSVFGTNVPTATAGSATSTSLVPTATVLAFTPAGALSTSMPLDLTYTLTNGATSPLDFSLDLTGTSQYGLAFGVNQLLQDGYTSGRLSGISVSADGIIQGRYSNGKSRNMGQLVLANFNNANGLQSL